MGMTRWDPFRDMSTWRDQMDRMFEETLSRMGVARPWAMGDGGQLFVPVDLIETNENIIVTASLPGVKPEEVSITVQDNNMTISGEIKPEEVKEGEVYFRERPTGSFRRSFTLPTGVNAEKVNATFENGVLKVMIPKTEEAKPKKIQIKTTGQGR
ncbi:MAG: Hsp20/alpha crystallin family protein [Chloroflexi bacterium]|jgi:HSP20 family protein|nr:Hsp20/alpha crystallin family protein [Chloroflexota bacterium]